MQNKISGTKWLIVYAIAGLVDIFQIIVSMTGIGILISEALEAIMPFVLIGIFQFFMKISLLSKPSRLLSIIGASGFDAITGGVAPFWIIDVFYIHITVKKEESDNANQLKRKGLMENKIRRPVYTVDENGNSIRLPKQDQSEIGSMNTDGIRPPNGGLND